MIGGAPRPGSGPHASKGSHTMTRSLYRLRPALLLTAVALVVSGCGDDAATSSSGSSAGTAGAEADYPSDPEDVAVAFGEATDCDTANKYLAVKAPDDYDFHPCDLTADDGANAYNYIGLVDCTVTGTENGKGTVDEPTTVHMTCTDDGERDDINDMYLIEEDGQWKVLAANS